MWFVLRSVVSILWLMYICDFGSVFLFAYERDTKNESMSSEEFQRAYNLVFLAENHRGCGQRSCAYSMEIVHIKAGITSASTQVILHQQALLDEQSAEPKIHTLFKVDNGKSNTMLLSRGGVLWFYKPHTTHAFRVSPQRVLLGHVSYADLIYTNYLQFYEPISLEKIVLQNTPTYKVTLAKVIPKVAYSTVVLYIADDKFNKPLKMHLYNAGVLRKTVYFYTCYRCDNGKNVQEWTIVAVGHRQETTLVRIGEPDNLLLPRSAFTLEGMKRL